MAGSACERLLPNADHSTFTCAMDEPIHWDVTAGSIYVYQGARPNNGMRRVALPIAGVARYQRATTALVREAVTAFVAADLSVFPVIDLGASVAYDDISIKWTQKEASLCKRYRHMKAIRAMPLDGGGVICEGRSRSV